MDTIFSLIGGAYRLVIDVPVFGIGILIGGFGYRYLLLKNPSLLQKLVSKVEAVVTKAESSTTPPASK